MEQLFTEIFDKWGPWGIVVVGLWLLYKQNEVLNSRINYMSDKYAELAKDVIESQISNRQALNDIVETTKSISNINEIVLDFVKKKLE